MSMRWLRLAVPAAAVAAWLAVSLGQQPAPPPATEETEAPEAPQVPEPAEDDDSDDVFVPTEQLEPDAAVTFPVDI
jgi:hypothetical protein